MRASLLFGLCLASVGGLVAAGLGQPAALTPLIQAPDHEGETVRIQGIAGTATPLANGRYRFVLRDGADALDVVSAQFPPTPRLVVTGTLLRVQGKLTLDATEMRSLDDVSINANPARGGSTADAADAGLTTTQGTTATSRATKDTTTAKSAMTGTTATTATNTATTTTTTTAKLLTTTPIDLLQDPWNHTARPIRLTGTLSRSAFIVQGTSFRLGDGDWRGNGPTTVDVLLRYDAACACFRLDQWKLA